MKVIIAEKPSVARELAKVFGANTKKAGYIEGKGFTFTWAFGHCYNLRLRKIMAFTVGARKICRCYQLNLSLPYAK